jgi:hypothetical protein
MEELRDSGELASILPSTQAATQATVAPIPPAAAPPSKKHPAPVEMTSLTPELEARLQALVSRSQVVLFMKGTTASPSCGFSDRMVKLLKDNGVQQFDDFDILTDPEVSLCISFPWFFSKTTNHGWSAGACGTEAALQLAYFPSIVCAWQAGWWPGYLARDD